MGNLRMGNRILKKKLINILLKAFIKILMMHSLSEKKLNQSLIKGLVMLTFHLE